MKKRLPISEADLEFYQNVVILCAGGTINMGGSSECKPAGGINRALQKIQSKLEEMDISFVCRTLFDRPPDSSNIGENEWGVIIDAILSVVAEKDRIRETLRQSGLRPECGGIVVAHGTDTLHLTSLVAALELSLQRISLPVVFTASHSTIDVIDSDATGNLLKSIYAVKECLGREANLLPGVYVLIGQDIHLASRLTKVYTRPNDDRKYFYSFPSPIGQITTAKKTIHFRVNNDFFADLTKTDAVVHGELGDHRPWGIVEHILLDKYVQSNVLSDLNRRIDYYRCDEATANRGVGVVIQGDFRHNPSFSEIAKELEKIDRREDVAILIGSKQTYEKLADTVSLRHTGLIPKSLSHLKAKIKLGWLLKSAVDINRVIELMAVNIAGEVFSTNLLPEWINFETFPNYLGRTEVVLAYPDIRPRVLEDAINRLLKVRCKERPIMYIYGFGDGHYPAINLSIAEIVRGYIASRWNYDIPIKDGAKLKDIICALNGFVKEKPEWMADFFGEHFTIDHRIPSNQLLNKYIAARIKENELEKIRDRLVRSSDVLSTQADPSVHISVSQEDLHSIARFAAEKVRVHITLEKIHEEYERIYRQYGMDVQTEARHIALMLAGEFPEVLSRRIIKCAIMSADENLRLIGTAVDHGIEVYIKTLAVKSKSNLERYEVGNMLMALGAKSDTTQNLLDRIFLPKTNGVLRAED